MRNRVKLLAIGGVLAIGLAACGGSDGDDGGGGGGYTSKRDRPRNEQPADERAPEPAPEPVSAEGIATGQTSLGDVLVDAEGLTLYGFTNDTNGTSTCFDACAEAWPAVPGGTAIGVGLDQSLFRSVDRDSGESQLAAGKWPMYTYAGDGGTGDVNGQGASGVWFALAPDGSLIK